MEPSTARSATDIVLNYGIIGVVALVFGYVIIALYKKNEARVEKSIELAKEMASERASFALREAALRAEAALREVALRKELAEEREKLADEFAKDLRELRVQGHAREDQIRREYTELMETVSAEATKQAGAMANVMDKVYDRIISPRAPGRG